MRPHRVARFAVMAVVIGSIVIAGFGWAVLALWNWLMPAIFGLPPLGFWQAVGLLGLSWILFGGWRGFGHHRGHYWRQRMHERWEQMTPEERENFRKAMAHRCGYRRTEPDTPSPGS
jgi:hypothetical protein